MATAKISELTISSPLSGSELFEMTQETNSYSASAGMVKKYALSKYAKISDTKGYDEDGGTFTSGSWQTRVLNTTDYDPDGIIVSLSSNQFTLSPGIYRIIAFAPANRVGRHVARLYNITDSSETILGTISYAFITGANVSVSIIKGYFTITNTKIFEIQHRCEATFSDQGYGLPIDIAGISSVYTIVELWKIDD